MLLSRSDHELIQRVEQMVKNHENDLLSGAEFASWLVDHLAYKQEIDDGFRQCMARISERIRLEIANLSTELRSREHPGERLAYAPFRPTAEELESLDRRVIQLADFFEECLRSPPAKAGYEIDVAGERRQKWNHYQKLTTVLGERCRNSTCTSDRVQNGVFCSKHHFEMVEGYLPSSE